MASMLSPILGKRTSNAGSSTAYASLSSHSSAAWDATESNVTQIIPSTGILQGLWVKCSAPGAGKTRTFVIRKNGAATSLSVTISGTATSGYVDLSTQVTFAAGDLIALESSSTGTPATSGDIDWYTFWSGVGQPLLLGLSTTSVGQQVISGIGVSGSMAGVPWATDGTITKLRVSTYAAPGTGKSYIFELYKNGSSTGLIATISDSATSAVDSTHSVSVTAGDYLYWKQSSSGSPSASTARISALFTPTINGETVLSTSLAIGNTLNTGSTVYDSPIGGIAWNGTEANRSNMFPAVTFQKLQIKLSAAPGAAKQYTFTLRKNAADTAVTTVITGASTTTGADTSHSVTCAAGDLIAVSSVPSGTPASAYLELSVVAYIDPGTVTPKIYEGREGGRSAVASRLADDVYWQPIAGGYPIDTYTNATDWGGGAGQLGFTMRNLHLACYDADFIRAVFGMFRPNTPTDNTGEAALAQAITIKASIQRNSTSGPGTQDGVCDEFTFSNNRSKSGTYEAAVTDPTLHYTRLYEKLFVRPYVSVANTNYAIPGSYRTRNRALQENAGTGDGYSNGDLADSGTIDLTTSDPAMYGAHCILGFCPSGTYSPSLALLGDSMLRTGGGSILGVGADGYGVRIAMQQLGATLNLSQPVGVPFCSLDKGGEFGSQFLAAHTVRLDIAKWFTTHLVEYGRHDLSDGVTTALDRTVSIVNLLLALSRTRRVIVQTLTPDADSTDGFLTLANQTPGAKQTQVLQYNAGLAAKMATVSDPSRVVIWDAYALVGDEDGYWLTPSESAPYLTGTVSTANNAATTLRFDTTLTTLSANADRGFVGVFMDGAAAGEVFGVRYSKTTGGLHQLIPLNALNHAPGHGDTLRLYTTDDAPLAWESPHLSSAGHRRLAAGFSFGLIL